MTCVNLQLIQELKIKYMISRFLFCSLLISFISASMLRINPRSNIEGQIAGIIVTIHDGTSYDQLFYRVVQKSKQGSVVLTYKAESSSQNDIHQALQGNFTNSDSTLREFVAKVQDLTSRCPSCIVFNWECSSGYSDKQFNHKGKSTFSLLQTIIKRGYMAMFSDFSLKALINDWDSHILGPNPFVQVGQTSTRIKLVFQKDRLLRSPSSQLQAVAQLAQNQELDVNVLGGTIIYGVDSRVNSRGIYELETLTVASNFPAPHSYLQSKIDEHKGLAGHVLLSYQKGGKILTSMGHWIELMKITTSEQKLFETAERLYGAGQVEKIKKQYAMLVNQQQKIAYQSKKSRSYIQNQSPGSNRIIMDQSQFKGSRKYYDL